MCKKALIYSLVTWLWLFQARCHPCLRECIVGQPPLQCSYDFHLEYYYTMSKACYDCPLVLEDCSRQHCIAADGMERGIAVINRQMPGPAIEVCEGDEVIVNVKNHLLAETTTIHWHGIYQLGTPFMDGVPLLTQCPITPQSTFQYRFNASNPGTHYYHSHSGFQRVDGVFGSLIVRQPLERDVQSIHYDEDLPEHVILLSDWQHELGLSKYVAHHHDDGNNKPSSILVNGKGRIPKISTELTANETMPYSSFDVTQGRRYRFRVISNGFLNCPIQLSVDNHTLLIIAVDGKPVQPIIVDSVVIAAGERYDFVFTADQDVATYWMRLHGLMDCTVNRVFQGAILRYSGTLTQDPALTLNYENTIRDGTILNPVNTAPGDDYQVTISELRGVNQDENLNWTATPDYKFFLAYDFNPVNNLFFHDPELYPVFGVEKSHRLYTPQLNHISLGMPPSPPLTQYEAVSGLLCNESTVANCQQEFCSCPYTLDISLGALVELIVIDEGFTFDATHPFHLHGHSFAVLGMERIASNVTVDLVREMDATGLIPRNFANPPIKDTVSIPDGGYVVVRFIANNPGYWLFHCHLEFHIEVGMGLIFRVGGSHEVPPAPNGFPMCGNWKL